MKMENSNLLVWNSNQSFTVGVHLQRWFINGSHKCFTDRHVLLGLWAIFMLLVCAVLILFLFLVAVDKIKVS